MRSPMHLMTRGGRTSAWAPGLLALLTANAWGQALPATSPDSPETLSLKSTPVLQEKYTTEQKRDAPTFIRADNISGRPNLEVTLDGQAEFRRGETIIRAEHLEFDQASDITKASGGVRINQAGNIFEGPSMELKVNSFEGFIEAPSYELLRNNARGEASRMDFLDEKRLVAHDASFTTCQRVPGADWLPDWVLRATAIRLDSDDEEGIAENARLNFKGVNLLSLSSVSFPLTDKRKSGLLAPTFGFDSISGTEVTTPYYWNIAPNRDATLYPTVMSKRGINYGGEFRYLEPSYRGKLKADYMPDDALRGQTRWGYAFSQQGFTKTGSDSSGNLSFNLNLNRVSDDNYWSDFPRGTSSLTQRLLASDASLNWNSGFYSASFRTVKWQTLQDPTAPIIPPYDRLPQLAGRYARLDVGGLDLSVDADYTQFSSNSLLTGQPNAQRSFLLTQVSYPMLSSSGFVIPKMQMHSANYQFDAPLATGDSAAARTVQSFSMDAGLVFERDASLFGGSFRQTLEPRLYYVNTPYVNQNYLPNYDSGLSDFNFASIYAENAFVGNDRISDNNLLTAGVTTRLIDSNSGAEQAKFAVAQRFRFANQQVTLPGGTPANQGLSDILMGAAVNWNSRWVLDTTVQYNPSIERSVRSTVEARYNPAPYRVINMAYRFQRNLSEFMDVGWQWPINDLFGDKGESLGPGRGEGSGRWYSVGRLNYSVPSQQLVDSIIGFEYDAGCWLGRIVMERLSTGLATTNQRLMFQLEFVGLSRVGIDPLSTLKSNIPRYQYLREQVSSPSRFGNYD